MKRSGSQQNSADAARQAAERLQEARSLMSDTQQQMASGKLGSLSQESDRIMQEERAQADRVNRFANQGNPDTMNRESMEARIRQRNQLATERQQLSDDLSHLQKQMRDSARSMASNQPGASQKLRQALSDMDEADLDNRVQRTADWLRRGINPDSNGTEAEIAKGLQKLSQQLHAAQTTAAAADGSKARRPGAGDQNAALDQVRRLRGQLEAMEGKNSAANKNGKGGGSNGPNSRNDQNSASGNTSTNQAGRGGSQGGRDLGQSTLSRNGNRSDASGEVRNGGGAYSDGTAWGNINTGNNSYGAGPSRPAPADPSRNPADTEQSYRQQLSELGRLGQMVQGDPALSREVRDLTRQLQNLDPKRFPGNPALVEQMHSEVLSSIDRIELQLLNNGATTEARSGRPMVTPSGYQDAVADYYRRLSSSH